MIKMTVVRGAMMNTTSADLTRQIVKQQGGHIKTDDDDEEIFLIPVQMPIPSALEQSWEPGPIANSRFSKTEAKEIVEPVDTSETKTTSVNPKKMEEAIKAFAPGWSIANCANEMNPGLHKELRGKKNALPTHPLSEEESCVLYKLVDIPQGKTILHLVVGHHELGDWNLVVADKSAPIFETVVCSKNTEDGWMDIEVDLSAHAGSRLSLVLMNEANGWAHEAAYWAKIELANYGE